jgi:hypothetical protein
MGMQREPPRLNNWIMADSPQPSFCDLNLRSQSQQAGLMLVFLGYRQILFAFETKMIIADWITQCGGMSCIVLGVLELD